MGVGNRSNRKCNGSKYAIAMGFFKCASAIGLFTFAGFKKSFLFTEYLPIKY